MQHCFVFLAVTSAPSAPGSASTTPRKWGKVGQVTKSPFASPRRTKKAIEMEIKGKKLTFHPPDSYNDDAVNTDPPQQRLKLEWA